MDDDQTGRRAFDFAARLVAQFGPRPAGSPAERAAQDWIAGLAEGAGYTVHWQSFEFRHSPAFAPYYSLAAAAFLLAAWLLPAFPWAALALPLLVAQLPRVDDLTRRWLGRRAQSANLLALPPNTQPAGLRLILCAHVDSARALPYARGLVSSLRSQAFAILGRAAWIMAVLALLQILQLPLAAGAGLAAWLLAGLLALAFIPLDLYDQFGARRQYATGANDNASGVGALLAILTARGPQALPGVGFLFTAAEETGLDGARAFARQFCRAGSASPAVLSVDMVGSGDHVRIFSEVRRPRRVRTSPALNALLQRADPTAVPYSADLRSGDFVELIKAGCPAAGIEAGGTPGFWRAYHTPHDTPEHLDPAAMARACEMIERFIELYLADQ